MSRGKNDVAAYAHGRLVHKIVGIRTARADQDKFQARLAQGWNTVLVKVVNKTGRHEFCLKAVGAINVRFTTANRDSWKRNQNRSRMWVAEV